jgi:hypothetical protein
MTQVTHMPLEWFATYSDGMTTVALAMIADASVGDMPMKVRTDVITFNLQHTLWRMQMVSSGLSPRKRKV